MSVPSPELASLHKKPLRIARETVKLICVGAILWGAVVLWNETPVIAKMALVAAIPTLSYLVWPHLTGWIASISSIEEPVGKKPVFETCIMIGLNVYPAVICWRGFQALWGHSHVLALVPILAAPVVLSVIWWVAAHSSDDSQSRHAARRETYQAQLARQAGR